jgi:hypothetical protein
MDAELHLTFRAPLLKWSSHWQQRCDDCSYDREPIDVIRGSLAGNERAEPWSDLPKLLALARHDNVVVKISGAGTLGRARRLRLQAPGLGG